jgi:2-phosphoglycerate kinase
VILCGAGVPAQFEQCIERRYFSNVHYLALFCDDETLTSRLRNRPAWRGSSRDEYIEEHIKFNRWLMENAQETQPPMTLLNTSEITVDESVEAIERWILSHLNGK